MESNDARFELLDLLRDCLRDHTIYEGTTDDDSEWVRICKGTAISMSFSGLIQPLKRSYQEDGGWVLDELTPTPLFEKCTSQEFDVFIKDCMEDEFDEVEVSIEPFNSARHSYEYAKNEERLLKQFVKKFNAIEGLNVKIIKKTISGSKWYKIKLADKRRKTSNNEVAKKQQSNTEKAES